MGQKKPELLVLNPWQNINISATKNANTVKKSAFNISRVVCANCGLYMNKLQPWTVSFNRIAQIVFRGTKKHTFAKLHLQNPQDRLEWKIAQKKTELV